MDEKSGQEPIVVGIDGSAGSTHALRWAIEEARLRGAAVEAIHAWSTPASVFAPGLFAIPDVIDYERIAKELLHDVLHDVAHGDADDPRLQGVIIRGYPPRVLLEHPASLLVVGSRGRGGFKSLLLGSVSQHCATHATGPVAVVPATASLPDRERSVVVGVDGSATSAHALDVALVEATTRGVPLVVLHAWWAPFMVVPDGVGMAPPDSTPIVEASKRLLDTEVDAGLARTGAAPPSIETRSAAAGGGSALIDASGDAGLLVVGSRGYSGFSGLLLGSVSQQCLHHARCAVLVVPPLPPAM